MINIGYAGTYCIKSFKRLHKRAGRKNIDLDAISSDCAHRSRETNRAGVKARRAVRPVCHHLQLSESLGDHGRREAQGSTGGQ